MVFCLDELRKRNKLINKRKYLYVFFILIKRGLILKKGNDKR